MFSGILKREFAECFRGRSYEELDSMAASFKLENCVKRDALNDVLRTDADL